MKNFLPHAILLDFYGTVVEEDNIPIGKICEDISKISPLRVTAAEVGSDASLAELPQVIQKIFK